MFRNVDIQLGMGMFKDADVYGGRCYEMKLLCRCDCLAMYVIET